MADKQNDALEMYGVLTFQYMSMVLPIEDAVAAFKALSVAEVLTEAGYGKERRVFISPQGAHGSDVAVTLRAMPGAEYYTAKLNGESKND